jgi:hypothetical protein
VNTPAGNSPTAAQKDTVGHDAPLVAVETPVDPLLQALAPPVGVDETHTFESVSNARQSDTEGHATAWKIPGGQPYL